MPRAKKDTNQRVQTPRGLPYGERQQMTQAQQQVPLPDAQARVQQAIQAAQGMQTPDLLMQPSGRPDEHPTTGLPIGPGAGPQAVEPVATPTTIDAPGLASYLPMLEQLADDPGATSATRNFVRQLRGSIPPSITQAGLVNGR